MSTPIDPRVEDVVEQLTLVGCTPAHLDGAVHDATSERATAINNRGLTAQVQFLLQGSDYAWKPDDIMFAAKEALKSEQL